MLWWCIQNTLIAGLLAGLVWLVCRSLRPSPAIRHALWLVVLVKLVTPPLIVFTLPVPDAWKSYIAARPSGEADLRGIDRPDDHLVATAPTSGTQVSSNDKLKNDELNQLSGPWQPRDGQFDELAEDLQYTPEVAAPLGAAGSQVVTVTDQSQQTKPPQSAVTAIASDVRTSSWRIDWLPRFAWCLWLSGAIAMAVVQLARIASMRRILSKGKPASGPLIDEVAAWATKLQIAAPPTLVVADLASPVVWSLARPVLVWPHRLSARLKVGARWTVIVHELAHIRRRDHWVGWLELVAGCIWWFNPLFWYVRHQLRNNAELACDAWVVEILPAGRRAYAEALIEVSGLASSAATPVLAMGMGHSARHTFERRLTMILRERVACRVPLLALTAIVLLGLAVLPSFSIGQIFNTDQPAADNAAPENFSAPIEVSPAPATPAAERAASGGAEDTANFYFAQLGTAPGSSDRISDLEKRLEAMLAEVRAMRQVDNSSGATWTKPVIVDVKPSTPSDASAANRDTHVLNLPRGAGDVRRTATRFVPRKTENQAGAVYGLIARNDRSTAGVAPQPAGASDVQTLTRAKYNVPAGKAEALATFLKESLSDNVETRVDNGAVIVTASPHAQQVIGQFIQLMQPHVELNFSGPSAGAPAAIPGLGDLPMVGEFFRAPLTAPAVQPPAAETAPVSPGTSNATPSADSVPAPAGGPSGLAPPTTTPRASDSPPIGLPGAPAPSADAVGPPATEPVQPRKN